MFKIEHYQIFYSFERCWIVHLQTTFKESTANLQVKFIKYIEMNTSIKKNKNCACCTLIPNHRSSDQTLADKRWFAWASHWPSHLPSEPHVQSDHYINPTSSTDLTLSFESSSRDFNQKTNLFSDEEFKPRPMVMK